MATFDNLLDLKVLFEQIPTQLTRTIIIEASYFEDCLRPCLAGLQNPVGAVGVERHFYIGVHDMSAKTSYRELELRVNDLENRLEALRRREFGLQERNRRWKNFFSNNVAGSYIFEYRQPMPLNLSIVDQIEWMLENGMLAECNGLASHVCCYHSADDVVRKTYCSSPMFCARFRFQIPKAYSEDLGAMAVLFNSVMSNQLAGLSGVL